MTHYSEEQTFIRAMPCPKSGAMPRKHCNRKPNENGVIKNHQERMWLWHNFVSSVKASKQVDLYQTRSFLIKGHSDYDELIDTYDEFSR
jgi:hypothetical protein